MWPGGTVVKNPPANAGDERFVSSIPGSGRSRGVGNGNPLQYSCLENPVDRGAWWATVHGVPKSQTQPSTAQHILLDMASLVAQQVKNPFVPVKETQVKSLSWEDPLEKVWQPTLEFLPGELHGQRNLWWAVVHGVTKSQT